MTLSMIWTDTANEWFSAPVQTAAITCTGFTDGWVEIETSSSDDGGLVLRFLDNEHYYLLAIRDDAAPDPRDRQNLQIYERSGPGAGGFTSIWQKDIVWPRGTMHRVRFDFQDGLFTVSLDGTPVGAVSRVPPFDGRGFGIRHYGLTTDWHARFRNFRWSPL